MHADDLRRFARTVRDQCHEGDPDTKDAARAISLLLEANEALETALAALIRASLERRIEALENVVAAARAYVEALRGPFDRGARAVAVVGLCEAVDALAEVEA
jgi:hypothetical protein